MRDNTERRVRFSVCSPCVVGSVRAACEGEGAITGFFLFCFVYVLMSNWVFYHFAPVGGSRGLEPKRSGMKGPSDRRMENGVSA